MPWLWIGLAIVVLALVVGRLDRSGSAVAARYSVVVGALVVGFVIFEIVR